MQWTYRLGTRGTIKDNLGGAFGGFLQGDENTIESDDDFGLHG